MIALADCNNFFASCERSIRPGLQGKPVVVLSNNDACIIARSNEAKALGYKMGEPVFRVKERLIRDKVHVFSCDVGLYRDISEKIMRILDSECTRMEVYSIDEAFMDFSFVAESEEKAVLLKEQVWRETKIPISVGIAKTKVLAKLASIIAKKHTSTGVFLLDEKMLIERALSYYGVEELWGVGRKHTKFLHSNGIFQASQLAQINEAWARRYMKIGGVHLIRELNGIPAFDLVQTRAVKKSIRSTRSFSREVTALGPLSEVLSNFACSCAFKLRAQKTKAKKIAVFVQTNRFKEQIKHHHGYLEVELPVASNDSIEIVKFTSWALIQIYKKDCAYKRAGVMVLDVVSEDNIQLNLFHNENLNKRNKLMKVYDEINSKMGEGTLKISIQGLNNKWCPKKEPIAFGN